jgi:peptidoglycan/xylan/chitin deacetylase (PgdA/CDA1 family)
MRWIVVVAVLALLGGSTGAAAADGEEPDPPACPESEPVVMAATPPPIAARIDGPAGVVALTFDAGADAGYAQDILDTLSAAGIPATFGMTGRWALANPELVNHTFDHRSFTGLSDHLGGLSAERRRSELLEADAIIAPLIGHTTCPWYRLPYGDGDRRVVGDVLEAGYNQQVGWTIDTLGWRGAPVQSIVARSLRLAAPDAVYVMHVGSQSRDGAALPYIIEGLAEMGYGFATVATLNPQ